MFVKTIGPTDAKIMLVGEAPGDHEDRTGKPFVPIARAGKTLDKILSQAGISRHDCLIANIARERPPGNKIEFFYEDKKCITPKPILLEWLEYLKKEIILYKPNIIIALGATACKELTGLVGIDTWRGYITDCILVPGVKVLPTYHPQKVNYEYEKLFQTVMDVRKAITNSETPDYPKDERTLEANPSYREFMTFLEFLAYEHKDPIAVDLEVRNPGSHIDIVGLADSPYHAMSLVILSGTKPKFLPDKELALWELLSEVLHKQPLIMQNGQYDIGVLWYNNHILCQNLIADTLIAGHVCWPELPRSLNFLASICLNVPSWKHTSESAPALYNCGDAANTYGCWEVLEYEINRLNLEDIFQFEMSQIAPATFLQLQGLLVDKEAQKSMLIQIREQLDILDKELKEDLGGKEVNLNSPKQLANLLYRDLGLPIQYKRRKSVKDPRKETVDRKAIARLARMADNPVFDKILAWKKLDKLTSFVDIKTSPAGKVHTSYNITGATMSRQTKQLTVVDDEEAYKSFGRWSSSRSIIIPSGSGNHQNIPKAARKIYRAPEGYEIIEADYVQAEAVVVAYESLDQQLINLYKQSFGLSPKQRKEKGLDVHLATGALMFSVPLDQVTPDQRVIGKMIRHATNYDAGPSVLADGLGCKLSEARELLSRFHNTCPQLKIWHMRLQDKLRQDRTLTNLLGRKHRFLGQWPSPRQVAYSKLFKSAYAYIPQSTVGDLLNQSLELFYKAFGDIISLVIQLHDAIYCYSPLSEREKTIGMLKESMLHPLTSTHGNTFTIDVDFSAGPSWGEMEELTDVKGGYN